LWLDGEAYFDVVHTHNHQPFIVKTDDGMAIEVLGTTFNVYHRTQDTKVVLNSGKIQLSLPAESNEERILMTPGDMVEFKESKLIKREVDANLYVAWTHDRLVLDHTSLGEIIQMLNDNYGVDVRVQNVELLKQTVSGSMPMPAAEESVDQIARAFRLKVAKDDDIFWLKE
jgi:ferric-dicitrate binding protein FerR (iron transport regulator)